MASIIDEVAPNTRFHMGLWFKNTDGSLVQSVQLVNRNNESVMTVTLRDGQVDGRSFLAIRPLMEHADYFVELAKRWAKYHWKMPAA